jgi:hypothetical protein
MNYLANKRNFIESSKESFYSRNQEEIYEESDLLEFKRTTIKKKVDQYYKSMILNLYSTNNLLEDLDLGTFIRSNYHIICNLEITNLLVHKVVNA